MDPTTDASSTCPDGSPLADGTYDTFVIDVEEDAEGRATHLELTVTAGPHKGEVLGVAVSGLRGGMVELVGMPASLRIVAGRPEVTIEG